MTENDGVPEDGGEPADLSTDDGAAIPTLEDIIAEVEGDLGAGAEGRTDAGNDDGTGGDDKSSAATAPSPALVALQKFADENYGGDLGKMLEAQYASRAEAARLKEENEALRNNTTRPAPRDTAAELKARQEQDSEIRSITSQITQIDASIAAFSSRNTAIMQEAAPLDAAIKTLPMRIANATDDTTRRQLEYELSDAKERLRDLSAEYRTNELAKRADNYQKANLNRDLSRAKESVSSRMQREEEEANAQAVADTQARENFDRAFDENIAKYALNPKDPRDMRTMKLVYQSARGILSDWLQSRGYDAPPLDYHGFVSNVDKLLKEHAAAGTIKLKTGSGARPAHRASVAPRLNGPGGVRLPQTQTRTGAAGGGRVPAANDAQLDDPNYWRQRAEGISRTIDRENARAAASRRGQ